MKTKILRLIFLENLSSNRLDSSCDYLAIIFPPLSNPELGKPSLEEREWE